MRFVKLFEEFNNSSEFVHDICRALEKSSVLFGNFRVFGYKDAKEFDEKYSVESNEQEERRLDKFGGTFFRISFNLGKNVKGSSLPWFQIRVNLKDPYSYELINIQPSASWVDDIVKEAMDSAIEKFYPSQHHARKYDV